MGRIAVAATCKRMDELPRDNPLRGPREIRRRKERVEVASCTQLIGLCIPTAATTIVAAPCRWQHLQHRYHFVIHGDCLPFSTLFALCA